jgi:formylglycine-generating enzyme
MVQLSKYTLALASLVILAACSGKKSGGLKLDGQVHGVEPGGKYTLPKPPGMVYIPGGVFHMGPSDEDVNYASTARNRQVTIPGFWMDATEVTNNQYRQFTNWVRDSIAARELGSPYLVSDKNGLDGKSINWKVIYGPGAKGIKYDAKEVEKLSSKLMVDPEDMINGVKEFDAKKIIYKYDIFDYQAAAKNRDKSKKRKDFITTFQEQVYPDSLVWVRDYAYSYNEPMARRYFSHPSFGKYPVVGVTWKKANAYCAWRTNYLNSYLKSKKRSQESDFRLPTEAEWEYAARGGRSQSMFPWGSYYARNKKGCLMANFKPGRGDYAADGAVYTWRADAAWPNDFGLYNMAGNVAEWTISYFYEGSYNFMHDLSPDVRYNAKESDPPRQKRKVLRGGSWKDVGFFLQCGTRSYEYQDTAKSYIGFRTVIDLPAMNRKR